MTPELLKAIKEVIRASREVADGYITGLPNTDKCKGNGNRLADALVEFDRQAARSTIRAAVTP